MCSFRPSPRTARRSVARRSVARRHGGRGPAALRLLAAVLLAGVLLAPAGARAQSPALDEARAAYRAADFERAIPLFEALYESPEASKQDKKEALQHLSLLYVAQDAHDSAERTIAALLELEPPLVELNPDVVPPPVMDIYFDLRRKLEGYTVQTREPGMKTLAVMDFTNASVDDFERLEPLEQGFASMAINYLSGATNLKVVERERIQWLLQEQQLQRDAGVVDQATAIQAGKLMGAHAVLFGAFTAHKKQMWVSARLVNVETGEIMLAEQIFGKKDDFFETIQDLSTRVARAINVTLEETELGVRTETRSLDAMLSYSEGLKLLEQDDYPAAYAKFNEALAYDPGYTRAKLRAESISPLLASR